MVILWYNLKRPDEGENFSLFKIRKEEKVNEQIMSLIKEPLRQLGIKIDKILYVIENKQSFLRIIIDKESNINIDDCVVATNIISPILDKADFIKEKYILDVCSKVKGE